ncbi:hypothetical protein CYMTET_39904 [Cymbomonas tetramitiformis]|uniref:Uncharacterized protein n=1 Tax=Cymbomonas tetramitiformis TaxID=36881 RepID=A0AAE0BTS1_9CHLO|nr:hypothetical protein CYMTET_48605 [Cymbomonas tetramitiformis]KAK3250728.1 hypothetical protein CYMTET_39904 [Cymbomonas tetramitiformis]
MRRGDRTCMGLFVIGFVIGQRIYKVITEDVAREFEGRVLMCSRRVSRLAGGALSNADESGASCGSDAGDGADCHSVTLSGNSKALAVLGRKPTDALAFDGLACSCVQIVELAHLTQRDLMARLMAFESGFKFVGSSLAMG